MTTPLAPLLLELGEDASTGCLVINDETGDEAEIFFKNGLVYSVFVPGTRPQLGAKLVSSGALAPEALAEALEAQRSELQGWRLGELLVHLGYVDQPVVEAFVKEQVSEALWDLLRWTTGKWKFRKNVKAREDVGPPMAVVDLLETLRERGYEWETISAVVHGPTAVPRLSTRGDTTAETTLDNDAWSMLCKIDNERSVADLARDCGYTLFEAGHVIVSLVQAGLVDIDEDIDLDSQELYGAQTLSSALAGDVVEEPEEDALSKLARLVTEVAGDAPPEGDEEAPVAPAPRTERVLSAADLTVPLNRHSTESFAAAISRVSSALSDVLGEAPDISPEADLTRVATHRRSSSSQDDPEWQRRKRLRSAAAAELASAQALIETLRPDHDGSPSTSPDLGLEVPKVLSTEAEQRNREVREAEEAARHAAEEAARRAAEEFARAASVEAQRVEAEQEAARLAAEAAEQAAADEAARLAAEQALAEQAAAEEAERLAAEQAAAEEAERQAAEQAAAEEAAAQLAAEAAVAEEAAWAEYWQREEAERAAAEEAARIEAERIAQEEAERIAQEEAARLAQEEAERAAAEEAARVEAERAAAEEAERQAAEQAAAEEAARLAAAEAERQAAEEAARLEAERVAEEEAKANAKAERAARRKAEKEAAAEAQRREDEAAAAAAMLAELNAAEQAEVVEPAAAEPLPEPEVLEPVGAGAAYVDEPEHADTAALLRELSSLGGDEPRESAPPTAPMRQRPTPADKKVKKKIGLFGL
ncbi:MAG: DUF4388 domain-containing protein [Frankiaceae bacterium]|nr:DUF4388 domain-containing protein [Frankiaceae bacterium]